MSLTVKSLSLAAVAATFLTSASAVASALPQGYVPIDGIEGTGTQWIDTGVTPSADLVTELRFTPLSSVTGEHILFGAAFLTDGYLLALSQGGYGLRWHTGGKTKDTKAYVPDRENTIVCPGRECPTLNGTPLGSGTLGTKSDVSKNILLFNADGAGETRRGKFRLHHLTMTNGTGVVRDFQPAMRISDGAAGLVDLSATPENERKVFYANEAEGEDFVMFRELRIAPLADEPFSGLPLTPSPKVTVISRDEPLVQGRDYTITYSDNLLIGNASLTVTGIGDYASFQPSRATFRIVQPPDDGIVLPNDLGVQFCSDDLPAKVFGLTVKDSQGNALDPSEYELIYYNNTAPGTAVVSVKVTSGPCVGGSAVRQFAVARMPEGYRWILYIEGTGTQWFDTGVTAFPGLTTRVKFTADQTENLNNIIFGADFTLTGYLLMTPSAKGVVRWHTGGRNTDTTVSFDAPVDYTAVGGSGDVQDKTIRVFHDLDSGYPGHVRLYSMNMSSTAGVVSRDLVPMLRLSDGKPGMFDLSATPENGRKVFYENEGEGDDFAYVGDYTVDAIDPQDYNETTPCTPAVVIRGADYMPLSADAFDIVYSDNHAVGLASVTVRGKAGGPYAGQEVVSKFEIRPCFRVTPDAPGGGTGFSWASPMTIQEAVSAFNVTNCFAKILLKSGEYDLTEGLTVTATGTLLGGYAGTDDTTLDPEGRISMLRAIPGSGIDIILKQSVNAPQSCNVYERIGFAGAGDGFVQNTEATSVTFRNCRFCFNGCDVTTTGGQGAAIVGTAQTSANIDVRFEGCLFDGNARNNSSVYGMAGAGILADTVNSLTVNGCTFLTNGVAFGDTSIDCGREYDVGGSAILANKTRLDLRNSRFVANRCYGNQGNKTGNQTFPGGTVRIQGPTDNCTVDHCVFVGNMTTGSATPSAPATKSPASLGGAIAVNGGTGRLIVNHCTFAYNLAYSKTAAAISTYKYPVVVRNSIFFGSQVADETRLPGYGREICIFGTGAINIDYSLVTAAGAEYLSCESKDTPIILGDHMVYGDPLFMTTAAKAQAWLDRENYVYRPEKLGEIIRANVHVRRRSEAIDTGDPAEPYGLEPDPNGGRLNIGAYGNTPEAARTPTNSGLCIMVR